MRSLALHPRTIHKKEIENADKQIEYLHSELETLQAEANDVAAAAELKRWTAANSLADGSTPSIQTSSSEVPDCRQHQGIGC